LARFQASHPRAWATNIALALERFAGPTGHYRRFQGRCVPLRDETGGIVKWYFTIHDIEDRKRTLVRISGHLTEAKP
jgi:PAS domain-containing protein